MGKTLLGKIPTISNKEINNKDNNKEKEKKYIKKRKNNFKKCLKRFGVKQYEEIGKIYKINNK